eukprot:jgi/Galph1/342/GphlegSOOS_G5098.1
MDSSIFFGLNEQLEKEMQVREALKELRDQCDATVRSAAMLVESLHQERHLVSKLPSCYDALAEVATGFVRLQQQVPRDEYYKYNELWRNSLAQSVFMACLVYYLENQCLADMNTLGTILKPKAGGLAVRIELEDYLLGVCNLISELARLSLNRVTLGDTAFAVSAAKFASQVAAGFRLFNFRNDYLRRRFGRRIHIHKYHMLICCVDGMKYDVKKLEEIVYDISIRGLISHQSPVVSPVQEKDRTE